MHKPSKVKTGRGLLTIIPLAQLLCYLGVVRPANDADLHFAPQGLEKLVQLWVDFLQITGQCTARYITVVKNEDECAAACY